MNAALLELLQDKVRANPRKGVGVTVRRETLATLLRERDMLKAALEAMTRTFLDGSHYMTENPYRRDVVIKAMQVIAECDALTLADGNDDATDYEVWSNAVLLNPKADGGNHV